jgi:ABC-type antimicrobial peptide transport system permease subunit
MAVRMAIGAGRGQVVRQLLIESLLLATLAGAVGSALSLTAIRAIYSALGGNGLPYWIRDPCGAWRASSTTLVARHTERA